MMALHPPNYKPEPQIRLGKQLESVSGKIMGILRMRICRQTGNSTVVPVPSCIGVHHHSVENIGTN